jgi:alanine-glyoxylate transaminase / serine-glyoxylate transaminase / serine-pyruvate transaminase
MTELKSLSPTPRRLFGPGPTNVAPDVLDAMRAPMLGHLDPEFQAILDEVTAMLGDIYRRRSGLSIALSATGTGGLEAGLAALIDPGETAIVGSAGFFGDRITELARRRGADVIEVRAVPGCHVPTDALMDALERNPQVKLIAVVHAETSTGVRNPVHELGAALKGSDAMLLVDCVTSLGGIEVDADGWGIDFAFSCTQKCVGAPPGMSPISISDRARQRLRERRREPPFYFDLELLERYWVERPAAYHHTLPILQAYALHAALHSVLTEGLEQRWRRHAAVGAQLRAAIHDRGLELLSEPGYELPQLTAIRVPKGVDGRAVQRALAERHGIEIGAPLSDTGPAIWRIGMMGVNATAESAEAVLEALDDVLASRGVGVAA